MAEGTVYTAGVDVGSLTTKAAIVAALSGARTQIRAAILAPTGVRPAKTAQRVLDRALERCGIDHAKLSQIVATGYGRAKVPFEARKITEISCHARGAAERLPDCRTVIDIGGQDSKVIRIGERGKVLDFVMNDKCAAGTGRFLEVMADALEVELGALATVDQRSRRAGVAPVSISSTCTVFAESEVISQIADGASRPAIILGLHASVADRLAAMANRVGVVEPVAMTGGVAKNAGVVRAIEDVLGIDIIVPKHPQTIGALGAALLALEQ